MLLGRGVARCSAYALQAGRAVRRHSTRAPRVRATAADEVDLPYRGVLADLRLPDSLKDEDAFDAWAAERERRWTRDGALSGWLCSTPCFSWAPVPEGTGVYTRNPWGLLRKSNRAMGCECLNRLSGNEDDT